MDRKPHRLLPLLAAAAALTACSGGDESATSAGGQAFTLARVRAIHAAADAPSINVVATQGVLFGGVEFKDATGFGFVGAGTTNIRIDGHLPGGLATIVPPKTLTFGTNDEYTLIVNGSAAAWSTLLIQEPIARVAAGSVRVRVVHSAPRAPAVDVYVTAPTALLEQALPLGRAAFGEQIDPVTLPAGDSRIRATLPNDVTAVVFDSGTVALPSAANLVVLAIENTGTAAAPISLLAVAEASRFEIYDAAAPAEVRVIHASPDAPAVDVVLDDDFASPLLEAVAYRGASRYFSVPPGLHNIKITAADNPGAIVVDATVSLAAGRRSSVYATGPLSSIALRALVDDPRSVATAAKVRVVHAAPSAGLLDVYVTARGAGIAAAAPVARGVGLRGDTGYLAVAAGAYDLTVAPAGSRAPAIGPVPIEVTVGAVYTAVASDAIGGGAPLDLIMLDGFAP